MRKTILVCPLNWGLGHATRCVPIIKALREMGHDVIIAADQGPLSFLQKAFPDVELVRFSGFVPKYGKGNSMIMPALRLAPRILISLWRDHCAVERIVANYSVDAVISDNRFGAWSRRVPSVYMTHQLHIQTPKHWHWTSPIIDACNKSCIRKYNECWIPDFPSEPFLAGKLAFPEPRRMKTRRLGILSRFNPSKIDDSIEQNIDYLVILSGPEPQRTIFENMVVEQSAKVEGNVVILRAQPDSAQQFENLPTNVTAFNHVDDELFVRLVARAKRIVCRGGYSSLMDLAVLNRNAFLVPTPGQTEQEYLAEYLSDKGLFAYCNQRDFKLSEVEIPQFDVNQVFGYDSSLLKTQLADWLKSI